MEQANGTSRSGVTQRRRDPDLWEICRAMCPDGGLFGLVPPEASDDACRTLGLLQSGAMIEQLQRGRIERAFYRGWWRLLTGRSLPEWADGRAVLYRRSAVTAAPFSAVEMTPLAAVEWPTIASA